MIIITMLIIGDIKKYWKKIKSVFTVFFDNLFNYKIKNLSNNNITCGFPLISLNKVKYILDKKYINYLTIDKSHNYEEIEKMILKRKINIMIY